MTHIIVKNGIAVYVNADLAADGTRINGIFDPTTRADNAQIIALEALPDGFCIGRYTFDGAKLEPMPDYVAEKQRNDILAQIVALEAKQTPRMLREAALGINGGKELLAEINAQIDDLRAQLPAV